MANDRLWLRCEKRKSISPLLGKYWVDRFDLWAKSAFEEWVQGHWLGSSCDEGGDSYEPRFLVVSEGQLTLEDEKYKSPQDPNPGPTLCE